MTYIFNHIQQQLDLCSIQTEKPNNKKIKLLLKHQISFEQRILHD